MLAARSIVAQLVVLASILTAHVVNAVAACSLCLEGEDIAKPEKLLVVIADPQPNPIQNCRDLRNLLTLVEDDDPVCWGGRAIGSFCGCPARPESETSCTICEQGSNMTLPLQALDGLVELSYDPLLGVLRETSCELYESAIHMFQATEQICLDLPFEDLRSICGCRDQQDLMVADTTCTLCAGGEQLAVIPDTVFPFEGEEFISCKDAFELAKIAVKGSDDCQAIQAAGTLCGCPVPDNACELCSGGTLTEPEKLISIDLGDNEQVTTTCNLMESTLHLADKASEECLLLDPRYAQECGCSFTERTPCTLCLLGDSVPFEHRDVRITADDFGFGILNQTCRQFESTVSLLEDTDPFCHFAQMLGKMCGCSVRENACSICGSGNAMMNPEAKSFWLVLQNWEDDFARTTDAYIREQLAGSSLQSCEVVDSVFSVVYDEDDAVCFWHNHYKAQACGCEGGGALQVKAFVWTQFASGTVSLIGSSCIVLYIISRPKGGRWTIFHQIAFGISVFDALGSIAFMLGTLPVPAISQFYGAHGNDASCTFQGWMFQAGEIAMYYNVALSVYYLLAIKYDWSEQRFQRVGKYCHGALLFVGLTLAFASIPFHEPSFYRLCYVARPLFGESYVPSIVFFLLPVGLCILLITICTLMMVWHVYKVEKKTKKRSMRNLVASPSSKSLARMTMQQSSLFLGAFYLVWSTQFSAYLMAADAHNIWWIFVGAAIGPSQGFFNALIFFNRRRGDVRRSLSNTIARLKFNGRFQSFSGRFKRKSGEAESSLELDEQQHRISVVLFGDIDRVHVGNVDDESLASAHDAAIKQSHSVIRVGNDTMEGSREGSTEDGRPVGSFNSSEDGDGLCCATANPVPFVDGVNLESVVI